MNILVIASTYPSPYFPQVGTFVYKLIQKFVEQNNRVTVISPQSYTFKKNNRAFYGNEKATVLRPKKLSFSNKKIGFINTYLWTSYFQARAIKRAMNAVGYSPDVVYCHFISTALHYYRAFPDSSIPVYIAVGEYRNIDKIRKFYNSQYYIDILNKVSGFIAVSPYVEEKLLDLGIPQSKIIVEPNATDLDKFKPRNKNFLRKKYNLPLNKKILIFVGRFLDQKGPLRVQAALDFLSDDVAAIFIGKGNQNLSHPKILFCGAVKHDIVADYLALSDVFVLPTLHEGSSNVIIEAMASGLPIVSSDIPEIRLQCQQEYSILVDPMEVEKIADALNKVLSNDNFRREMSVMAIEESKKYDIKRRAERILKFIKQ